MNNVKRGEVAEGRCSKNTVAVVQRVDVHHTQIQQLQHTRVKGQNDEFFRSSLDRNVTFVFTVLVMQCERTCVIWMYVSCENCGTRKFSPSVWAST